jgi:hypothetical protein
MSSTSLLTAEVAELRQVVRDLVDAGRDVLMALPVGPPPLLEDRPACRRLAAACARGDRIVGRAP